MTVSGVGGLCIICSWLRSRIGQPVEKVEKETWSGHEDTWCLSTKLPLRDKEGNMVVKVDGATLMRSTDRAVQKDFNGFAFINNGGDYALKQVVVSGVD